MKWVITAKLHLWWQEKLDFLLVFDTWHDINSQKVRRDFGIWSSERRDERGRRCLMHCTPLQQVRKFVGDVLNELCWWGLRPKYPFYECYSRMTPGQLLIWAWLRGRSPKLLWAWDQSWSRQPWMWSLWPVYTSVGALLQPVSARPLIGQWPLSPASDWPRLVPRSAPALMCRWRLWGRQGWHETTQASPC